MSLPLAPTAEGHGDADPRWVVEAEGKLLRLRPGLRGRYTFGARVANLGGRTFEWEIKTLSSPAEVAHDGSPLWVGREITGTIADLGQKDVIGRAVGKGSGRATGPSTPALLWRAIEVHCGIENRQIKIG